MAKVRIVYVPDADRRGPDLTRIGTVEEHPDEVARVLVAEGAATWYQDGDDEDGVADPEPDDGAEPDEPVDLMTLTKAQLLEWIPEGVAVPAGATKADLIGLIRGTTADHH